jgi:rhodanese-related sulfurtransferase
MKQLVSISVRALVILVFWGLIGIGVNALSSKGVPWQYVAPKEVVVSGVRVPLVDEKEAFKFLDDPESVFLDTREKEHFVEGHVKGALSLPKKEMEERFLVIQPLAPEDKRLILYCYGPECEDAERVADFLAQLGYKNMAIMSPGFPGWKQAGYPVAGSGDTR